MSDEQLGTTRIADGLRSVVDRAEGQLRGFSAERVSHRSEPGRWTIKEILGHLIDSAANNHQRFVRAPAVDAFSFPRYEQDAWVGRQHYNDAEWGALVDLWVAYNRHLDFVIRNVPLSALPTPCRIGDGEPVTLAFLIEDYLVHLKHHLRQIATRMKVDASPYL